MLQNSPSGEQPLWLVLYVLQHNNPLSTQRHQFSSTLAGEGHR